MATGRSIVMKLRTKLKILTSMLVLAHSMGNTVDELKRTNTALIVTTSALVTFAAFALGPRVSEEVKARRALS
ncbi:MAG: hypothetical protein ACQEP4_05640 [Bacillota bacterium]